MGLIYEFKECKIHYEGEKTSPLNFSIKEGEKIAIITSRDVYDIALLFFLFFLENSFEGEFYYKNISFNKISITDILEIRKNFAHVSSHLPLVSNLKIIENVYLPLLYHTNTNEQELFDKAYNLLDTFGLTSIYKQLPAFLNPFERKCVLFARAWICEPKIIYYSHLLDDTNDSQKTFFVELIKKFHCMKDNRTTIMSFRNKNHINNFFDKIITF